MPLLEEFVIGPASQLKEVPFGIKHLKSLKRLKRKTTKGMTLVSQNCLNIYEINSQVRSPNAQILLAKKQNLLQIQHLKDFQVPDQIRNCHFLNQPKHQWLVLPCIAAFVIGLL
nr:hypothetical protein CFP56_32767 [Quercus suber]